jgi:uncharacterized protein YkwD
MLRNLAVAILANVFACCATAAADTLWTENAENGAAFVIDGTSASYPLIQSETVGEGDFAFHLAHPNGQTGQDEWFVLDKTIRIQPTTKLFFLSRLGWATTSQIARVQISTNGGSTWPTNIYNQAGTGGAGEGVFSLKQINLASYANQDVRFRFFYDTTGTYFPQTDPDVGWFVDNIQIGDELAKLPWSIGEPTEHEQLYLEYLNRARADAFVEATRLRNEPNVDVQNAYNFFGIEGPDIENQFNWYVTNGAMDRHAQPLSFEPRLLRAAQLHSQDQFTHSFQGHFSSDDPPDPFPPGATLGQRLAAVGYSFQAAGENVYATSKSAAYGHAGFDVDWGDTSTPGAAFYNPAFEGQGMQNPAGHRRNIHNGDFKEVGIGVVLGTKPGIGPQVVTQDFGTSGAVRYITGVVYRDLNGNSFYDLGEGREDVRIDVEGSAYYAISTTSGGYSVPVPEDGAYEVTFTGGGFQPFFDTVTVTGGLNVKLDYLVSAVPFLAGDYNGDGTLNTADYAVWRNALGRDEPLLNDDTPGVKRDDFDRWKTQYSLAHGAGATQSRDLAAAPEPAALVLFAFATSCGLWMLRRWRSST